LKGCKNAGQSLQLDFGGSTDPRIFPPFGVFLAMYAWLIVGWSWVLTVEMGIKWLKVLS